MITTLKIATKGEKLLDITIIYEIQLGDKLLIHFILELYKDLLN